MTSVWYASREDVKSALDVKDTSRINARVDRALESASRQVESILHRRFYPEIATRYFPWPDAIEDQGTIWFDDSELISATTVTSSGTSIAMGSYYLEPNRFGPPYNRIEMSQAAGTSLGGGYGQRDVAIAGTWGYQNDETSGAVLSGAVLAGDSTITTGPGFVGMGQLLRVDSERMIVTGKSSVTTGQALTVALLAANNGTTVTVADGTKIAVGETVLIDAEYMRVVDIAGNNLIVQRAWDGSILAAHTIGAVLYAPRKLTVSRGQLGTTAAGHADAASVLRFAFPGPVRTFTIALAMDTIEQESVAYARTTGSGNSIRDTGGRGLELARKNAIVACGRFARMRTV